MPERKSNPDLNLGEKVQSERTEHRQPMPWNVIWAVVAFIIGAVFTGGQGWGRSNSALENLTLQISHMDSSLNALTEKFNSANSDTRERLKGVEDEVKTLQNEVDDLRRSRTKTN
jgi:hypothetical protein